MLRTRENFDVFNSLDEIYLVFTSKKQISSIYFENHPSPILNWSLISVVGIEYVKMKIFFFFFFFFFAFGILISNVGVENAIISDYIIVCSKFSGI